MKKVLYIPALVILVLFLAFNTQSQDKQKKEKVKAEKVSCGTEMESCGSDMEACGSSAGCSKEAKLKATLYKPWNSVCPVQGEKVDPKVKTVKYDGKEYGFCCTGCDEKFQKDPAKYSKNLSKDGKVFASK